MTRVLLAVILAASLGSPQDRPDVKFRSGADAVRVDVLARRGNQTIIDLSAADFELRDSGVVQEIRAVSTEQLPVTLLLALDTSDSVQGSVLDNLKAAARSAVNALGPDDQVSLLTFTQKVQRQRAATGDRGQVHAAIDRMGALGSTAMNDAIVTAIALGEQPDHRVVLLVFTDGVDTASWLDAEQVLDATARTSVVVYSVSISSLFIATSGSESAKVIRRKAILERWFDAEPDLFPQGLLHELAERTGGEAFYVRQGGELAPTFARIISEFKTRYLLTYSPRNVPASGWHPIEVKLKNQRGTIHARRGYWR